MLWVVNDSWPEGRTGSLQRGLLAVPDGANGVIVHAVDHPDVRATTIRALVAALPAPTFVSAPGTDPTAPGPASAGEHDALQPARGLVLLPSYQGRRGHPVLLSRAVWPEVFALAPDEPLSTVVQRDPARIRDVAVDDAGILRNRNERRPADRETSPAVDPEEGRP